MFFNEKFNKKFQEEMIENFKKVYRYDSSVKVEVTQEFKKFKKGITLQGQIKVTSNTLYFDSLITPFLKHILKITAWDNVLQFDIVTTRYNFIEED